MKVMRSTSLKSFRSPPCVPKEDVQDAQEAAEQDVRLKAEGVAEIAEERATQIAAVADGVDPKKEAARIRERHIREAVSTTCRGNTFRKTRSAPHIPGDNLGSERSIGSNGLEEGRDGVMLRE